MANLNEFRSSLETTQKWIQELMATLQTDETTAVRAFRAIAHELRDHLTVDETAHLAAQLPLLLRGVFYEGWRPAGKPVRERSKEAFLDNVWQSFREVPDRKKVESMVREVFMFLDHRVSAGEIRDIVHSLPKDLKSLWPAYAGERHSA